MVRVCAVGLSLLLASSTAFAQVSATTGSINGKVTDNTGGVLPGVTVTASSPSMQGTRTDVTNENGEYRFPAVPPGTYKLAFELAGFGTVNREGVNVGLGFTATVNTELGVASLQETVTVSGESPVVDVSTTTTASNFGEARLAALPNARDFWAVLAASPAIVVTRIDVGGSAAGTQTGYAVYDTKEDQHRPMVEGIVNTEGTNAAGFYYDYGAIDEVAVTTKGHTAEMPWPGVWSNFVSKSGGAEFHGKLYGDYQNKSIQRENIPNDFLFLCPSVNGARNCGSLTPSDLNRMNRYYDVNGDIGGYVPGLKDKLWWYGSLRQQDIQTLLPNFPVKPFETRLRNITGKVTYSLSTNNKFTAYAQGGQKLQPNRLDRFIVANAIVRHESEDSTWEQRYWGHTYKAGYESVLGDNSFLEARAGQFKYDWPNFRYSDAPSYEDTATGLVRGGNRDGWFNTPSRNQIAGSVTYYKDGWAGSHNFKLGGEWFRETFTYKRGVGVDGVFPGDVLHLLNNGAPVEVLLFESPSTSEQGLRTTGFYLQDTWRLNARLTLNVGMRFDRYRSFLPEQEGPSGGRFSPATATKYAEVANVQTFNHPVPRFGLIYDITGQGRTVLKANYAQYYWNPGTDIANLVNPNSQDYYKRYNWTDGSNLPVGTPGRGNGVFDIGETIGAPTTTLGGVGTTQLDPNLKNTQTREVSAWVEHELIPGIGVQGGYVFREIDDFRVRVNVNRPVSAYNVPVTLRDPGADGVFNTGDDGPNFQAFNLSAAALALPNVNQLTNLDGNGTYHTVEFGVNKRQTGRYSVAASMSKRWNRDHSTAYFGQNLRSVTTPSTANDFINTDDGQFRFSMWTAKVNGSYEFPYQIRVTPALRFQSGQPYGRTINASAAYGIGGVGGINYGTQRILMEKLGARKQDNIAIFDLRAEKYFNLPSRNRIGVFLDVYNLGNSKAYQNIAWSSGATFEQPSTIVPPTIARFGLKFDW